MSAPSPAPANMPPPPTLKRPRQSTGTSTPIGGAAGQAGSGSAAGVSATTTSGTNPRVKRRKNEADDASLADGTEGGGRGKGGASTGAGSKGKEKETDVAETGEVQIKIDFREMPVETLYKYLEHNDLLPRWTVSPWSEDPCLPPNALYTATSTAPVNGLGLIDETSGRSPSVVAQKLDAEQPPTGTPAPSGAESNVQRTTPPKDAESTVEKSSEANGNGGLSTTTGDVPDETMNGEQEEGGEMGTPATRTTRSKTAPQRKQATPSTSPGPSDSAPRPVITLSDVHAARDVLAERANAHWIKGLGGGQNKEGETIVNFLYKMKVGPGRLLRVYNPPSGPHGTV